MRGASEPQRGKLRTTSIPGSSRAAYRPGRNTRSVRTPRHPEPSKQPHGGLARTVRAVLLPS